MGLTEWAINMAMFMILANVFFFMMLPNAYPDVVACMKSLDQKNNPNSQMFNLTSKTTGGHCAVDFTDPSSIPAAVSFANLPNQFLSIFFSLPIIGNILQQIAIGVYILTSIATTGWISIYNTLFLGAGEAVRSIFFGFGMFLTLIQLYGVVAYLSDLIQKIRVVFPGG